MLAATLCTIHNERFIVSLVDRIRASIETGDFEALRAEFLGRYYAAVRRYVSAAARCAGPGCPRAWPARRPAARRP